MSDQITALLAHPTPKTVKDGTSLLASELDKLQAMLQPNGHSTGGEGVELVAPSGNGNQLSPSGNFSQCLKLPTVEEAVNEQLARYPLSQTVTWSDGSTSHAALGKTPDAQGATETTGSLTDTVRVEIGAAEGDLACSQASGLRRSTDTETLVAVEPETVSATTDPAERYALATGWPAEADVLVMGFCPNPRLCVGAIVDQMGRTGRKVSVWQGRFKLRAGKVLKCKLDLVQGDDARYLPIT